jgi:hypothetical protein
VYGDLEWINVARHREPVVGSGKHGNESSCFIQEGEVFHQLSNYQKDFIIELFEVFTKYQVHRRSELHV